MAKRGGFENVNGVVNGELLEEYRKLVASTKDLEVLRPIAYSVYMARGENSTPGDEDGDIAIAEDLLLEAAERVKNQILEQYHQKTGSKNGRRRGGH